MNKQDARQTTRRPQSGEQRDGWRTLRHELMAGLDWGALRASPLYYGFGVPRGDGSPVILVPGFLGTDLSLLEMHLWLGRIGYRSYRSGIGWNADCPDVLMNRLERTIDRVHRETGRKVHLIGHSLGGTLARAAAVRNADKVAQVITLGSPYHHLSAHAVVRRLVKKVLRDGRRRAGRRCMRAFATALRECIPGSVSLAAVCSREDAVVNWRDCSGIDGAINIEVKGAHLGLAVNAGVYRQVARLLAEPEAQMSTAVRPGALDPNLPLAA